MSRRTETSSVNNTVHRNLGDPAAACPRTHVEPKQQSCPIKSFRAILDYIESFVITFRVSGPRFFAENTMSSAAYFLFIDLQFEIVARSAFVLGVDYMIISVQSSAKSDRVKAVTQVIRSSLRLLLLQSL